MFTYTVKYEDFDGNQAKQELCFHIGKAELMKLATTDNGVMDELMSFTFAKEDERTFKGMFNAYEKLIGMAYGIRSGQRFVKSEEITEEFLESLAYDQLIWDLVEGKLDANKFLMGIFPMDVMESALSNSGLDASNPEAIHEEYLKQVAEKTAATKPAKAKTTTHKQK